MPAIRLPKLTPLLTLLPLLAGCDMLGLPNPAKEAAQIEAEAKAVGAACRHSGRSLEDCYALYPDQARAQVFAGWRDMQDYMAAGNLTAVPPTIEREPPKAENEDAGEEDAAPARSSRKRRQGREAADDGEERDDGGATSGRADAGERQAKSEAR